MFLSNGRLSVELLTEWHDSTRFDRTATVKQVTLNTGATFCAVESLTPGVGSGGIGLCNEFGIAEPIGYDDAAPGECFLKPGVGWLTRDEKPYSFQPEYPVLDRGEVAFESDDTSLTVRWASGIRRGYGCRYEKRYSIEDNVLTVDYAFQNTGEKIIETTEYAHNFVIINHTPYGDEYRLVTDDASVNKKYPALVALGQYPSYLCVRPPECENIGGWTLTHMPGGLCMSERVNFPVARFAVWAQSHVVSAEVFKRVSLARGAGDTWRRRFTFAGPQAGLS